MKFNPKLMGFIFLLLATMLTAWPCISEAMPSDEETVKVKSVKIYENHGLKLPIPAEYDGLLAVTAAKEGPLIFSVAEKASIEAAKAQGGRYVEGAGWLFGIGTISEAELFAELSHDMSGREIFAKDDNGLYYVYYHPTDVRMVRENYADATAVKDWTLLNEWAWGRVRGDLVAANAALTAETYGNSDLDMHLAKVAFDKEAEYSLVCSSDRAHYSNLDSPAYFALRLIRNSQTEAIEGQAAPPDDYITLNFPKEGTRFDFFLAKGSENIYRQSRQGHEQFYKLTLANELTAPGTVMKKWWDAMAAAESMRSLGYKPDDLIGRWAEKIAGRGLITIVKGPKDTYAVRIEWADGAARQHVWEMTAISIGEGGALRYDNGKHLIRTYDDKGNITEEKTYENGCGQFYLNSAHELMWEDEVEGAGRNVLFISADG